MKQFIEIKQSWYTFTLINRNPIQRILLIYKDLDNNPAYEAQVSRYYKMKPGKVVNLQ
jgi:hypothetical protein